MEVLIGQLFTIFIKFVLLFEGIVKLLYDSSHPYKL